MKYRQANRVLEILHDPDAESPRSWSNLGTMVCWHRRERLGDRQWDKFTDDALIQGIRKSGVVLPLYLYQHSGMTMRTTPFGCPWDSGQVGFIYADADRIRKEYGVSRISARLRLRVERVLLSEVEVYNQWLTGEVYGFQLFEDGSDDPVDSCYGFFGSDPRTNGTFDHAGFDPALPKE